MQPENGGFYAVVLFILLLLLINLLDEQEPETAEWLNTPLCQLIKTIRS